jgi:sugar phosphate isomerase/epimerase
LPIIIIKAESFCKNYTFEFIFNTEPIMNENKIKYACADFTFPLLAHKDVLHLVKMLGFRAVDLGIFEGRSHHYPSDLAKNPIQEGIKLDKILNEIGLKASDVFLQTGKEPSIAATNIPDKSVREKNREIFLKMLDFTLAVKSGHITGLPGVPHQGEKSDDDWNRACEETIWRLETAHAKGVLYSIEPHLGSILNNPATTLQFISDCPGLTLTLDYGHFIYQGQSNESIHPLLPYASHFHARGGAKEKLQTMVSENEIDFMTIISKLKEINYSGFICFEYVYNDWGGCNRTDNVSETILLHELLYQA